MFQREPSNDEFEDDDRRLIHVLHLPGTSLVRLMEELKAYIAAIKDKKNIEQEDIKVLEEIYESLRFIQNNDKHEVQNGKEVSCYYDVRIVLEAMARYYNNLSGRGPHDAMVQISNNPVYKLFSLPAYECNEIKTKIYDLACKIFPSLETDSFYNEGGFRKRVEKLRARYKKKDGEYDKVDLHEKPPRKK